MRVTTSESNISATSSWMAKHPHKVTCPNRHPRLTHCRRKMADSQEQHPWRQRTGISIQHLYLWEANTIRSLRLNHHSTPSCVKEDFFFPSYIWWVALLILIFYKAGGDLKKKIRHCRNQSDQLESTPAQALERGRNMCRLHDLLGLTAL